MITENGRPRGEIIRSNETGSSPPKQAWFLAAIEGFSTFPQNQRTSAFFPLCAVLAEIEPDWERLKNCVLTKDQLYKLSVLATDQHLKHLVARPTQAGVETYAGKAGHGGLIDIGYNPHQMPESVIPDESVNRIWAGEIKQCLVKAVDLCVWIRNRYNRSIGRDKETKPLGLKNNNSEVEFIEETFSDPDMAETARLAKKCVLIIRELMDTDEIQKISEGYIRVQFRSVNERLNRGRELLAQVRSIVLNKLIETEPEVDTNSLKSLIEKMI